MIKRTSFTQEVPASLWDVTVPQGGSKARPLAAYETNGNSHEIDSWAFDEGHLLVNFGIDPVAGDLEYEYQVEGDDPVIIEGDGGVINIHVTQNNTPRP